MADGSTGLTHLIAKFEQNLESYRNPAYGEAEVRVEFINPLFEALGWDVTNKAGIAEAYKDVIHEDAVKVGGATKAPDYSFRIGGTRKFFLEAKKPWCAEGQIFTCAVLEGAVGAVFGFRRWSKMPW